MNWFWEVVPYVKGYRPLYGILFFGIVDSVNKNRWRPVTRMDCERIVNKCGFTKEVYYQGRRWLAENNFIEFTPGINNFQMASFSLGSAVGIPAGTLQGKLPSTLTGTLTEEGQENLLASIPNNKNKTNKELKDKPETNILNIPFTEFWNLCTRKVGYDEALEFWKNLTNEERSTAMEHIPKYNITVMEKYHLGPAKYLRIKTFNDKIANTKEVQVSIYSKESTYIPSGSAEVEYFARLRGKRNSFMSQK